MADAWRVVTAAVRSIAEPHAFSVLAGVASMIGAVLSYLAWRQAKTASTAAQEARQALLGTTTADELNLACARAEQLLDFMQHRRFGEAILRAEELVSSLSELTARRQSVLPGDCRDVLLTVRAQLQSIPEALNENADDLDSYKHRQLLVAARGAGVRLREVLGNVRMTID